MKKLNSIGMVAMLLVVACGGSGTKEADGIPQLVHEVSLSNEMENAIFAENGNYDDFGKTCIQRLQYVKDGKVVDERIVFIDRACNGAPITGAKISKRFRQTSGTQLTLISDTDASKTLGVITRAGDGRWYLDVLCNLPNAGTAHDRCTVAYTPTGNFGPLTER